MNVALKTAASKAASRQATLSPAQATLSTVEDDPRGQCSAGGDPACPTGFDASTPPNSSPRARGSAPATQQVSHELQRGQEPGARRRESTQHTHELLNEVEALMRRVARGHRVDRTGAMALEALETGGKRFRARLALHVCLALGVDDDEAVAWAAAVELLHNATLIHGDVQDEDTTRRGAPTLWVNHGVAQAINAGDFMLMLPFLALAELPAAKRGQLSGLLAQYATQIVRGQVEELGLRSSGRIDSESYLSAASGKTGALIALPVAGAAELAGLDAGTSKRLAETFLQVGVLFQLQDDVIDLFGDKGRDEVGCDVYEGKISALVVAHLELAEANSAAMFEVLDKPRSETTALDVQRVKDMFLASGALSDVLNTIESIRLNVLAAHELDNHPELRIVTDQLIEMALTPVRHLISSPKEQRA